MPTEKRKMNAELEGATSFRLLSLPLEIRLKVYEYCYLPCSGGETPAQRLVSAKTESSSTKIISSKARERSFFENSRCDHPFFHQSLLLTCRQTYIEVWPYYVQGHSLGFNHPIKFANEYLSFQPPHRLASIKHLSLRIGDDSITYNPASTSSFKGMIVDVQRLVNHYPDVFLNLLSFTWEACDKRTYCPSRWSNEKLMYDALLHILVGYLKEERLRLGLHQAYSPEEVTTKGQLLKWRTGLVARKRSLKIDNVETEQEQSSMVFFEQIPNVSDDKKGLRYINVARWLGEPIKAPASRAGQRVHFLVNHETLLRLNHAPQHYAKNVHWNHLDIDWKSGTDVLRYADLIDVGT